MKVLFYLIISFYSCGVLGQNEAANWYFGFFTGVRFEPAARPLYNGRLLSEEGSATISDRNGNLLFYSNGNSLFNRSHALLKNSSGLLGDRSSTQNVVIVPQPGNDSIYFVFTVGSKQQVDVGLNYSVVNMKGDNGFGEVVQKNTNLLTSTYEKISAVKHCNNRDVWVTVRKWDSDQYYTYLVTNTGVVSTPVISSTGLSVGGDLQNSIGALKFSCKGNKLAAALSYGTDKVELLDFNNQTGVLSNPIIFRANTSVLPLEMSGTYGLDFSPDTHLLYVSVINSVDEPATIYQFDITSNNVNNILASRQTIAETFLASIGNIQIATDGKLYVAYKGKKYLGVINAPNMPGAGCNFQLNGLDLSLTGATHLVQLGLPTFIQSYFDTDFIPFDFNRDSSNCTSLDVVFKINHITGADSLHWYFGDGTESTSQSLIQSHHYNTPGYYTVKLKIFSQSCSGSIDDAIVKQVWIAGSEKFLGNDSSSCAFDSVVLQTNITGVNYNWNTGSNASSITVNNEGTYWLELEKNGCRLRDSVILTKIPVIPVNLGRDTTVCTNKEIILDAAVLNASYLWNTGETTRTISINKPGKYNVMVSEGTGCAARDSVEVSWGDCDLFIPSAFSPNGDGVNELFGLINGISINSFSMKVYNRNGQVVFSSSDQFKKWDGKYKNKPVPLGVYPWVIRYTNKNNFTQTETGTVMLIR